MSITRPTTHAARERKVRKAVVCSMGKKLSKTPPRGPFSGSSTNRGSMYLNTPQPPTHATSASIGSFFSLFGFTGACSGAGGVTVVSSFTPPSRSKLGITLVLACWLAGIFRKVRGLLQLDLCCVCDRLSGRSWSRGLSEHFLFLRVCLG